jgi:hypothetical protein
MLSIIFNAFFSLCFFVFAYFNLNDKDSLLWVTIYLIAAVLCGLAAFKRFYPKVCGAVIILFLIYAGYLFFTKDGVLDWMVEYDRPSIAESMQATKPYIEQTREFFGLLICIVVLALNFFFMRHKTSSKTHSGLMNMGLKNVY